MVVLVMVHVCEEEGGLWRMRMLWLCYYGGGFVSCYGCELWRSEGEVKDGSVCAVLLCVRSVSMRQSVCRSPVRFS